MEREEERERGQGLLVFTSVYTVLLMQTLAGINVPVPNGYICTRRYKSTRCLSAFLSTDLAETCRDCS